MLIISSLFGVLFTTCVKMVWPDSMQYMFPLCLYKLLSLLYFGLF